MIDSFRHQGLRKQLVEHLALKGISNLEVLNAMNKIPRHLFMDNAFVNFACIVGVQTNSVPIVVC